ncbi:thermonuclease family protein [Neisseriaceae bacterium ESL0693]|nr:thermonuclease family protein [Neisseriaceae bacterium ESL0693]
MFTKQKYLGLLAILFIVPLANAHNLNCKVVKISDGDTVRCLDQYNQQHRIRLAGIDAPESKQAYGQVSKQSLADMIFQKQVNVDITGTDRYGRKLGIIYLGQRDINREQVARGMAWSYVRYPQKDYAKVEAKAKNQRLGLWRDQNPVYPETYRHQKKNGR